MLHVGKSIILRLCVTYWQVDKSKVTVCYLIVKYSKVLLHMNNSNILKLCYI